MRLTIIGIIFLDQAGAYTCRINDTVIHATIYQQPATTVKIVFNDAVSPQPFTAVNATKGDRLLLQCGSVVAVPPAVPVWLKVSVAFLQRDIYFTFRMASKDGQKVAMTLCSTTQHWTFTLSRQATVVYTSASTAIWPEND